MHKNVPDRKCSPSIFWLITNWHNPSLQSLDIAICVLVGLASSQEMLISGFNPFFSVIKQKPKKKPSSKPLFQPSNLSVYQNILYWTSKPTSETQNVT